MRETYLDKGNSIFDMPTAFTYQIINASIYYFKWKGFHDCMSISTSHRLWVFFGPSRSNMQIFSCHFSLHFLSHKFLQNNIFVNMGGEVKKLEPEKCHYWKKKKEVWHHLEKKKVASFIEKLHGHKPHVADSFYKSWDGDKVTLYGRQFTINAKFIAEVTGLPNEGMNFFKEKNIPKKQSRIFQKMTRRMQNQLRLVIFMTLLKLRISGRRFSLV